MKQLIPTVLAAILVLLAGCAANNAPPDGASTMVQAPPSIVFEFKIDRWRDNILVPVSWGGEQAYFLLDTGSGSCDVDSKAFSYLKVVDRRDHASVSGGQNVSEMYEPPQVEVGPLDLSISGPAFRDDLTGLSTATGRHVIGVLGSSAFSQFVVQVDFDSRVIRLIRPDRNVHPEWGEPYSMPFNSTGAPQAFLNVAGVDELVTVATGNELFLSLPKASFDRVSKWAHGSMDSVWASSPLRTAEHRRFRISSVQVAGTEYKDQEIVETAFGMVGREFIERNLVTIDYPSRRLYIKPGKELNKPADHSNSQ